MAGVNDIQRIEQLLENWLGSRRFNIFLFEQLRRYRIVAGFGGALLSDGLPGVATPKNFVPVRGFSASLRLYIKRKYARRQFVKSIVALGVLAGGPVIEVGGICLHRCIFSKEDELANWHAKSSRFKR